MPNTDVDGCRPDGSGDPVAALRVLASSSSGNCSVMMFKRGDARRVALVDLGLSPRRTRSLLAEIGLTLDDVDHVLLTHLDSDHFRPSWSRALPEHVTLHLHRSHAMALRAERDPNRLHVFDDGFELDGVSVQSTLVSHDDLGVAAFRFEHDGVSIGYATDLGRPCAELAERLAGVDLLAIESNYCPKLQMDSRRPEFLKRRITGGRGHLSNQQCAELAGVIRPARDVVLLHLSRQCNTPALAEREHGGASYRLTISRHDRPTPWITLCACAPQAVSFPPSERSAALG